MTCIEKFPSNRIVETNNGSRSKFFTYVAKASQNFTEWSHQFTDHKKCIWFLYLHWHFCHIKTKMSLLFYCTHRTLSSAVPVNQNKPNGQIFCEKVKLTKIFDWLQRSFTKTTLHYVDKYGRVLVTLVSEKFSLERAACTGKHSIFAQTSQEGIHCTKYKE